MKAHTLHRWYFIHKWTSLICTLFLLGICLTGLPLIFADEIGQLLDDAPAYPQMPASTPRVDLDILVARAKTAYPGQIVRSMYFPDDEPAAVLVMAPSQDADDKFDHDITYDARTGLEHRRDADGHPLTFMDVMRHVHEDLFLELPGELFLALMSVLFLAAIVSGIVLYGPFMRRVAFGTLRRSGRIKWLDLHNLLSAVTLLWAGVIGITGFINELSTPLFGLWMATDVRESLAPYANRPFPAELSSVSAAVRTVEGRMPDRKVASVVFPTRHFGSPHHYVIWTQGNTVLTSRIFTPTLVDAGSGDYSFTAPLPWYLQALEVSRPLHFGDYGGTPLKVIWAALDLLTIVVLLTGLKLWWDRRRRTSVRSELLASGAHGSRT